MTSRSLEDDLLDAVAEDDRHDLIAELRHTSRFVR
jgi:hypothetical protein